MERRRKFNKPMAESSGVAHAATREDGPDVWIFDFRCEKKNPDRVHFSTDRGNQKFRAFTANDRVAFAALPFRGTARTRTNMNLLKTRTMRFFSNTTFFLKIC